MERRKRKATGDWHVKKWHGIETYQCNHCPFSTIDKGGAVGHAQKHAPKMRDTGILDLGGRSMRVEEPPTPDPHEDVESGTWPPRNLD